MSILSFCYELRYKPYLVVGDNIRELLLPFYKSDLNLVSAVDFLDREIMEYSLWTLGEWRGEGPASLGLVPGITFLFGPASVG